MIFSDKVIRFSPNCSKLALRFRWCLLRLSAVRAQIEAPVRSAMVNVVISGKAITPPKVPMLQVEDLCKLVKALNDTISHALVKRAEATFLRLSAWAALESALFFDAEDYAL